MGKNKPETFYKFKPYSLAANDSTIDKQIKKTMNRFKVIGLSSALVRDKRIIWSNTYGWADALDGIPVHRNTVFRVASISKLITATALMQQFEKGKFELDDDVGSYLGFKFRNPNFPNNKITFHQLLTHTSSLVGDELSESVYVDFCTRSQISDPPLIKDLFEPGKQTDDVNIWSTQKPGDPKSFAYSNLSAIILATLVEKLSGQRFDQYCINHIFKPLGMGNSNFNIYYMQNSQNLATLYEYEKGDFIPSADIRGENNKRIDFRNYELGTNGSLFSPQGGLRTNAEDLSLLMIAFMGGGRLQASRILEQKTVDLMLRTHWNGYKVNGPYMNSLDKEIGLQFHITNDLIPGEKMIGHTGEAYGLQSAMYFNYENEFGLVLIMNGSDYSQGIRSPFYGVTESVVDILYEEMYNLR